MDTKPEFDGRKFNRAPFRQPVKVSLEGQEIPICQQAHDIGQGGIRINSDEFVALGAPLRVFFQFDAQAPRLELDGKVVWVRYVPRFEAYQMGVEFLASSFYDKQSIVHYVGQFREGLM